MDQEIFPVNVWLLGLILSKTSSGIVGSCLFAVPDGFSAESQPNQDVE